MSADEERKELIGFVFFNELILAENSIICAICGQFMTGGSLN
jgi:hypothetical protein